MKKRRKEQLKRLLELAKGNPELRKNLEAEFGSPRLEADVVSGSWDSETRSFEAVLRTETALPFFDWDRWEVIDEVHLMSGFRMRSEDDTQVPLLDSHSSSSVKSDLLGSVREIRVEGTELRARCIVSSAEEDTATKIAEGHIDSVSVGINVLKSIYVSDGETLSLDGTSWTGPINLGTEWELVEVSLVYQGHDPFAKIMSALSTEQRKKLQSTQGERAMKKLKLKDGRELSFTEALSLLCKGQQLSLKDGRVLSSAEDLAALVEGEEQETGEEVAEQPTTGAGQEPQGQQLAAAGGRRTRLASAVQTATAGALVQSDGQGGQIVDMAAIQSAERERVLNISHVARQLNVGQDVVDQAIEDGLTLDQFLANQRRSMTAANPPLKKTVQTEVGENRFLMAMRQGGADALRLRHGGHVENPSNEAIDLSRLTMAGLFAKMGMATGEFTVDEGMAMIADPKLAWSRVKQMRFQEERQGDRILSSSRRMSAAGAMTTDMFPNVLTSALNAELIAGYEAPEVTWNQIALVDTMPDLRNKELVSMSEPPRLQEAKETEGLTYSKFSDKKETYALGKYQGGLLFTEEDFLQDRFGAFMESVAEWGMWAAIQLDEGHWFNFISPAALNDGNAFWLASTNYFTGSGTALSTTSLPTARQRFMTQVGDQGKDKRTNKRRMISVVPRILIVPPTLTDLAEQLLNSRALPGQDNPNVVNTVGRGLRQILEVPYFEHPDLSGASTKAWHLAADKVNGYSRVAFLNGVQAPIMESMMDFDTSGMKFKLKMWWAYLMLKRKYIHRMKGEA